MKIKIKDLNLTEKETLELENFVTTVTGLNYKLDYDLTICNENLKEEIHKKYFDSKWIDKYAYRAFTIPAKKVIFVFYNEGETINSLKWIIAHELTHANLRNNMYLRTILNVNLKKAMSKHNIISKEDYEKKLKDDKFHEDLLEEQICNQIATSLVGQNYDRIWWRNQIKKVS